MLGEIQWLYSTIVDRCPAMPTSEMGHPRPGRARSRSGQVRDASKAEVISKHVRLRDGPLWFDARPWANITLGAGCSGRGGARRRTALTRRVKSCGPGAPTLASSSRGGNPLERRWQESPVTGETTKETVKTTAQGMPVDCGVPVVTTLVCSPFLHARLWVRAAHPAFPAPSVVEGYCATARALSAPRGCGVWQQSGRGSFLD